MAVSCCATGTLHHVSGDGTLCQRRLHSRDAAHLSNGAHSTHARALMGIDHDAPALSLVDVFETTLTTEGTRQSDLWHESEGTGE